MTAQSVVRTGVQAKIRARRSVVQALYQWGMSEQSIAEVIREFEKDRRELDKADVEYFRTVLRGVEAKQVELDRILTPLLDRAIGELDPVEKAILYLGTWELLYRLELPWKVVLNESIELAKMFGAEQSHKYVNGILDRAAHQIRTLELAGRAD